MEVNNVNAEVKDMGKSPSGLNILWREIVRDKVALVSLVFLVLTCLFVYGISIFLDQKEIVTVDLFSIYAPPRSEEHTSELQSRGHLVCRLLLEKKKNQHK